MPAIAPNIRQRLLCRSDLHAMEVDGERIAQWLRGGQLVFLGHVEAEDLPGGDAVYATDDEELRADLQRLLSQQGRDGVALGKAEASALLLGAPVDASVDASVDATPTNESAAAQAPTQAAAKADMISEHVVEEGLDETIDEITEAIDNLLVSTHNAPLESHDDGPFGDAQHDSAARDVVEVEQEQPGFDLDEDILVEIEPEEVEVATEQTMHDRSAEPRNAQVAPSRGPTAPTEVRVALDAEPVTDALRQILDAVRALGERQLPQPDLAPVTASIEQGLRSLQATVLKATSRSATEERLDRIHDALLDAVDAVRELGDGEARRRAVRSARRAHGGEAAARPRFSFATTRENVGAILATASTLIGWSAAAWLYATDGKLALGALACANLVACAALLGRKPAAN